MNRHISCHCEESAAGGRRSNLRIKRLLRFARNDSVKVFALLLFIVSSAYAKEVAFNIGADSNQVAFGESLQLSLNFEGTQNIPALELSNLESFQARYLGPSTRMSIVNGQVSSSITHIYSLLPVKAGVFKIGPLRFDYQGDTYISNLIEVEVIPSGQPLPRASGEGQPQGLARDINERVFLVLQPQKTRVYLNEVIPLKIKLYVNGLSLRDIEYPQFNHEGLSIGKFSQPKQYRENLGGVNYEVVEFNTQIFALRTGELRIGPASLRCNLLAAKQGRRKGWDDFFEDFFDSYQNYPLNPQSADMPITALPLPEEGRPADFSGAVGAFDFQLEAGPRELKAGDPVTLKGIIRGRGNFSTLTIPRMQSSPDFKVYEPQANQKEDDIRTFEQVVMPLSDKVQEIPKISLNFFNPDSARYERVSRGPFPITVSKPQEQEELKIVESYPVVPGFSEEEKLGRDIIYIKTGLGRLKRQGDYLYRDKAFLALQSAPFFSFLFISLYYSRKRKLNSDLRYSRQLNAPKKARSGLKKARGLLAKDDKPGFYDAVFETLQEYLGDKFHLPSKGITVSVIDEILKDKPGIDKEALDKLKDIFQACDMARYAASQSGKEDMTVTLRELEEVIGYFQREKV